jgi:hypothetical protein
VPVCRQPLIPPEGSRECPELVTSLMRGATDVFPDLRQVPVHSGRWGSMSKTNHKIEILA